MHPSDVAPGPAPALWDRAVAACQDLRGHRLPWVALAFGSGIGLYFALPVEPTLEAAGAAAFVAALLLTAAYATRAGLGFFPLLGAILVAGALAAQWRSAQVGAPVLGWRYYGAVEGRVIEIDRSASGATRLTLDRVRLDRMSPSETPDRVRISMQEPGPVPPPGTRVMTTAHLSPPAGATEPGGFDFQRHAYFEGLGALGYTRVPILRAAPPEDGPGLAVERIRRTVAEALRSRMPGQRGEVAAAITTGDRSGLSDTVTEALRASNLAHLLAISGLHMGLLVGFVLWLVRGGLALVPSLALRHSTRAWAAAAALPFALAYLFLSGGSVATQRAFVMAAVMLGAILLGRRALSIRSVAIAALLVLFWRPESLVGPGFQMSFAATGALVLAFGALSRRETGGWMRGWRGAAVALLLSSVVAGAATGPIAAVHFNRIGQYGVLANLLAVPMMGFAVMPLLFVGLLLMPLGLEWLPLRIAGWGIEWILAVAERVADLPGAVGMVQAPGWQVLPLIGLGMGLVAAARSGVTRGAGGVLLLAATLLWARTDRPDLLISDDGRLVGAMTRDGRWLSRDKGVSFVAEAWLENDGDGVSQEMAAGRDRDLPAAWPALSIAPTPGAMGDAVADCAARPGLLIGPGEAGRIPDGCTLIDLEFLERTGAVSLRFPDVPAADGAVPWAELRSVAADQGDRPWSPRR